MEFQAYTTSFPLLSSIEVFWLSPSGHSLPSFCLWYLVFTLYFFKSNLIFLGLHCQRIPLCSSLRKITRFSSPTTFLKYLRFVFTSTKVLDRILYFLETCGSFSYFVRWAFSIQLWIFEHRSNRARKRANHMHIIQTDFITPWTSSDHLRLTLSC